MGVSAGSNITLKILDKDGNEIKAIPGGTFSQLYSRRRPVNPGTIDHVLGSLDWLTDVMIADTQAKLAAMTPCKISTALTSTSSRLVCVQWDIGSEKGRQDDSLTMSTSSDPQGAP